MHKEFQHPVSALSQTLSIPRSTLYYQAKAETDKQEKSVAAEKALADDITDIFGASDGAYGSRKIKAELAKNDKTVSRRRISRIMKENGLESCYTKAKYKVHHKEVNQEPVPNEVDRQFDGREPYEVLVSDLTYIQVKQQWMYLCIIVDLFNREIVGYSVGKQHDTDLVVTALYQIPKNLRHVGIFHSDRGGEFKGKRLKEVLEVFQIKQSLSKKGCPYDNAVAESCFKTIKTEFSHGRRFVSKEDLEYQFAAYVKWYNTERIHGSLGYMTPQEYRLQHE